MPRETGVIPGTLAMLVLRVLRGGPLHGYAIAQRIRRALGAPPSSILATLLNGLRAPTIAGALVGTGGAAAVCHALRGEPFHLTFGDPLALCASAAVVLAAGVAAVLLPGLRALALDPVRAIRFE